MRLVFAGTPEFARVALERLHAAGHDIALVLTQPDRPAGRGLKLQPSSVKQFALGAGLALAQPRSLRLDGKYPDDARAARAVLEATQAQAMVVAAYGLILPQWVLDLHAGPGQFGCLNIHASLLPRWRGAAPIQRAIEAGDAETGVTIMQMDAGLDTGDMLMMHRTPITAGDSAATLHDRLADLGGKLCVLALEKAAAGRLEPVAQPDSGVTYAHKIDKAEAVLDWRQDAHLLARRVRALDPAPGATTTLGADTVKVWGAVPVQGFTGSDQAPGTVLAVTPQGIAVAAGAGTALLLTSLQRAGGRRLGVADFLRGHPLAEGTRCTTPA